MANTNIPGVSFHYKDEGRLVPVITGPITSTVLIIGHAVDGPVNVPVKVNSKNVEQVFGSVVYDSQYTSVASGTDPKAGKYNGNSLVKAYSEVAQGGCSNIYLMRVADPGRTVCKQSTAFLATGSTYAKDGANTPMPNTTLDIVLKGKYPGKVYDGVGIKVDWTVVATEVTAATLTIRQDLVKKGRSLTYNLIEGGELVTKRRLIEMINTDVNNNAVEASFESGETLPDDAVVLSTAGSDIEYYVLEGGKNGVRSEYTAASDVYNALMGWYATPDAGHADADAAKAAGVPYEDSPFAQLESLEADVVYLAALYADENIGTAPAPKTIMVPFAESLHQAAKNDYPMVGVVGTMPYAGTSPVALSSVVTNLTQAYTGTAGDALSGSRLKLGYFLSEDALTHQTRFDAVDADNNEPVDLGRYVLCVAGPDVILNNPRIGTYVETGAGVYAGLLSTIPPYRAATNMRLPGVRSLAYAFTNRQLNKVAGGQPWNSTTNESGGGGSYVLFRRNINNEIVVNLDNSCAGRNSDYASYQITYIVNMVASGLKRVVEPFIGQAAHQTTKTALENQVRKYLDYIAETRAIAGGDGEGYEFEISASGVDQLLGRINIELTLRPALQIKSIRVTISVAPPTGA